MIKTIKTTTNEYIKRHGVDELLENVISVEGEKVFDVYENNDDWYFDFGTRDDGGSYTLKDMIKDNYDIEYQIVIQQEIIEALKVKAIKFGLDFIEENIVKYDDVKRVEDFTAEEVEYLSKEFLSHNTKQLIDGVYYKLPNGKYDLLEDDPSEKVIGLWKSNTEYYTMDNY